MAWGRNFPMSGQNTKDAEGTFRSDWSLAWVIGLAVVLVVIFLVFLAGGILR